MMRFFRYRVSRLGGMLVVLMVLSFALTLGTAMLYVPPAEGAQLGLEGFRVAYPELARLLNMRASPQGHEFLVSVLFGLLMPAVSILFSFRAVRKLQLEPLATGEMTWFLLSPVSRALIPLTHYAAVLLGLFLQYALVALTAWLARFIVPLWLPDMAALIRTCLGAVFMASLPLGAAICAACFSNSGRLPRGLYIVTLSFFVLRMLANLPGTWGHLRYLTPFTLFDAWGVLAGSQRAVLLSIIPPVSGLLLAGLGALRFSRNEKNIGEERE